MEDELRRTVASGLPRDKSGKPVESWTKPVVQLRGEKVLQIPGVKHPPTGKHRKDDAKPIRTISWNNGAFGIDALPGVFAAYAIKKGLEIGEALGQLMPVLDAAIKAGEITWEDYIPLIKSFERIFSERQVEILAAQLKEYRKFIREELKDEARRVIKTQWATEVQAYISAVKKMNDATPSPNDLARHTGISPSTWRENLKDKEWLRAAMAEIEKQKNAGDKYIGKHQKELLVTLEWAFDDIAQRYINLVGPPRSRVVTLTGKERSKPATPLTELDEIRAGEEEKVNGKRATTLKDHFPTDAIKAAEARMKIKDEG